MIRAKKLIAAVGLAAMMFQALVIPASAIEIVVSGNGVDSDSDVTFTTEQTTTVTQTNEFNADNNINANANTGNNSSNSNTGGDTSIDTGNATSTVGLTNAGNANHAVVDCCASAQDVSVLIEGNGDSSDNDVVLANANVVTLEQSNESDIDNDINNDATTGWNTANRNTGGSVLVTTGVAKAVTTVFNGGNINSALIVGGEDSTGGVSAIIRGNGVDSDNDIALALAHTVSLDQANSAHISNYIDTDAVSGKNSADSNTGGEVTIDTGDAEAEVFVDNAVNFNFAEVDCGCLFDVTAKIVGNGDSSDNTIRASLEDSLEVGQENSCDEQDGEYELPWLFDLIWNPDWNHRDDCLTNDVYADAFSGWNSTDRNTGEAGSDPSIFTGNADTSVDVQNAGNSNIFGELPEWDFPEEENDTNVNLEISFDLNSLLEALGLLS